MPSPPGHPQHGQFLRLYAEHELALHTFVRSLLLTRQEASEVMQEVIVALWQGFASAGEFRPWAFGVARNQVRMYLRGRVRDRHVFDDELVNRLADLAVMQEPQHLTERDEGGWLQPTRRADGSADDSRVKAVGKVLHALQAKDPSLSTPKP